MNFREFVTEGTKFNVNDEDELMKDVKSLSQGETIKIDADTNYVFIGV